MKSKFTSLLVALLASYAHAKTLLKKPMGIAGLRSAWKALSGELTHSFTILTINADDHPFMRR